jgi:hypothetical protein
VAVTAPWWLAHDGSNRELGWMPIVVDLRQNPVVGI